ncbi:hypothetical protein JCM31271_08410 [Halorubrum trueperi]
MVTYREDRDTKHVVTNAANLVESDDDTTVTSDEAYDGRTPRFDLKDTLDE